MRYAGSEVDSLRGKIGAAAALTVEETPSGPKFRSWTPFQRWTSGQ